MTKIVEFTGAFKEPQEIKINPEFEELIPPLQPYEIEGLESDIVALGRAYCPLIVWNGYIIDGHHRYDICQKHGLPFKIEEREFEDEDDVMIWMIQNQIKNRRNIEAPMRIRLEMRMKGLEMKKAQNRMKAGKKIDPSVDRH